MAEDTKMESQLSLMQKLLEKLVDTQTSQAATSVTATIPTVISTTSTRPSVSDLTLGKCSEPSVSDPALGKCSVEQQLS